MKKCITVMCDYCADGLWEDGAAIDADILAEDFEIPKEIMEPIAKRLSDWQAMYENFDFWSAEADYEKIRSTPEFREFTKLGTELAREIRDILPDNIDVIYYDESQPARFYVQKNGEFVLKESYAK